MKPTRDVFVPPGGFAAAAQQTPAAQYAMALPTMRRSNGLGRKRRKKSATKAKKSRKRSGRKLKFGSPAWRKKYMKK